MDTFLPSLLSAKDIENLDIREIEILRMSVNYAMDHSQEVLKVVAKAVDETLAELGKAHIRCKHIDKA